jgi:(1->4)-alpha-D-glucan 1-alpha-D-glucosylmutase
VPLSTYRLQFNKQFTFADATELMPYLAALGISHIYASPYLRARADSMHGYDIIDHEHLNPEIGTREDYDRLVETLHQQGMGQILDVVPNHMGVMGSDNSWWLDVLENGKAAAHADFFDIDWMPLKDELQGKVLVPVLGDQYGTVLDRDELKLRFDREKGEFSIYYFQHRFPVNPREYATILARNIKELESHLGAENHELLQLQSLVSAFRNLPSRHEEDPAKVAERRRDKEIHKKRLADLVSQSPEIADFIARNVEEVNGQPGKPESFEDLHELIKRQAYRLAYWRVASDDINYRRFFDVNDLAALRMENEPVFDATHRFILRLMKEGKLDGLRIDHPDGLYNPAQYFERLQQSQQTETGGAEKFYLIIEKILTSDERLPSDWPIDGTTGYEFGNLVNGLFVDPDSETAMERIYRGFIGRRIRFDYLVYRCKKLVLDGALTSEINVLANLLSQIALANRHTCDFTVNGLREALAEVIAWFPVYRTYITADGVSDTDRRYIEKAIATARRRGAIADTSVFDFIRDVLLTRLAEGQAKPYRGAVIRFAMKFQQLTSAVMAKGLEDTSFYRYARLISLNEVGGDPRRFGLTPADFHRRTSDRMSNWPDNMLGTSTHDSKRSEDVRARINVLSEIPQEWRKRVWRWRELNLGKKKMAGGQESPTRNDEYFLYQTLVGAWPLPREHSEPCFCQRIKDYMLKAIREAKQKTSWANQNKEYESDVLNFVEGILGPQATPEFLEDFREVQQYVSRIGMLNSLSQTAIKLTLPGVPDVYQGTETWDFSLVDPDNRRPVNYAQRRQLLENLKKMDELPKQEFDIKLARIVSNPIDGRIKLYLTWRLLNLRNSYPDLFQNGKYRALEVQGSKGGHIVAYVRQFGEITLLVAVSRLNAQLYGSSLQFNHQSVWEDTVIELPNDAESKTFIDVLGRSTIEKQEGGLIAASTLFAQFPVVVWISKKD